MALSPRKTPRLVVVTGGPCAGKTAVLELARQDLCHHIELLPEAASIVLGGGFPRRADCPTRCASQRAIFHVQRELERSLEGTDATAAICDRGTIDGLAYWPGASSELLEAMSTTLEAELAKYAVVLHLRVPRKPSAYRNSSLRRETHAEAMAIDELLVQTWAKHPRRIVIDDTDDFVTKARRALGAIREALSYHVCIEPRR